MQQNISVVGVENITGSVSGGWVVTLRMENNTGYQPTLRAAEGDIYFDNTLTAHASLMAPVTLPKKSVSSIDIPLEIKVHSPLKALSLVLRFSEKNFDGIDLALKSTVELMGVKKDVNIERTPAKDILNQLGYN